MTYNTRGKCECGNMQANKGKRNGKTVWDRYCVTCKRRRRANLVEIKKLVCELCGFKAKHAAQMDIDHIDGDSTNNNSENLQEICANCHRLKTIQNQDWLKQSRDKTVERNSPKWIGRYARQYLISIGFKVSETGAYSKEMKEALKKAGIPLGRHYLITKGDMAKYLKKLESDKMRRTQTKKN